MRYLRNPAARLKQVGRETAVYLPETRAVHVLNDTARLVWDCLEEPMAVEDLVAVFARVTDGEPQVLDRDLRQTLAMFSELGIARPLDE